MSNRITQPIINYELSRQKNLEASSDVLNKDLNAFIHITEKVSKESEGEEHNGTVISECSEAEHIRVEVNYLDVVNMDAAMTQSKMAKEIANLIVAEIEGGDNYSWNFLKVKMSKKFGGTIGRFYYACCQSKEAQLRVDLVLNAAKVDIYHGHLYPRPNLCIEMPNELRKEIKIYLHLTIIELKNYLQRKGFDISKYSPKRLYFWKSVVSQKLFKRYDNYIESACQLLSEHETHGFRWCLNIKNSETTAIGFIILLLEEIKNRNINICKIYLDVTYKTTRGHYELYGVITD
ncbi:10621_t:CDS:2, partial [Ambispora gerdemannii]